MHRYFFEPFTPEKDSRIVQIDRDKFTPYLNDGANTANTKSAGNNNDNAEADNETYSKVDLEKAKEEGKTEGYNQGQAEMKALMEKETLEIEKMTNQAAQNILAKIIEIEQEQKNVMEQKIAELTRLALAITKKVVHDLIKSDPAPKIEEAIKNSAEMLAGKQNKIIVKLNTKTAEKLKERINKIAAESGFTGEIEIKPDDEIADTDCWIEWQNGGTEMRFDEIWQQVEKIIQH